MTPSELRDWWEMVRRIQLEQVLSWRVVAEVTTELRTRDGA